MGLSSFAFANPKNGQGRDKVGAETRGGNKFRPAGNMAIPVAEIFVQGARVAGVEDAAMHPCVGRVGVRLSGTWCYQCQRVTKIGSKLCMT